MKKQTRIYNLILPVWLIMAIPSPLWLAVLPGNLLVDCAVLLVCLLALKHVQKKAVVKQLCSTDEIFAEKKYKAPFAFTPSHTLVLYTNHLPKVGANDDGIWRRLIVIPFNAKIEGDSDIKNYAEYLYRNAGGYILKWIIEGAKKAVDADFKTGFPQVVKDAIRAYREDNDWLGHFLNECCEADKTYREKSGVLYQEYRSYCLRTGEYTRSTADFYNALESAGFSRRKAKAGIIVYGLRIKEDDFGD